MFQDRIGAGKQLAKRLLAYRNKKDVVVLGIPRGGVVVAKAVANALALPLDIIVVRKIGAPQNPELAIGAVGPEKTVYWDQNLCQRLGINKKQKSNLKHQKERERKERESTLRGGRKPLNVKKKTVILVDDGIATGATVLAAQKALQKMGAAAIVLAVPVVAKDTYRSIAKHFGKIVALEIPSEFYAVGQFYQEFSQVEDNEVVRILRD